MAASTFCCLHTAQRMQNKTAWGTSRIGHRMLGIGDTMCTHCTAAVSSVWLAALSAHPLVSFLARQLLADVIAAVGSRDLAAQELSVLHKLLGAAAAAAAVPGAGWETQVQAEAVQDCLVSVLQVGRDWSGLTITSLNPFHAQGSAIVVL